MSSRDWLETPSQHALTCVYEHALRAASGIAWQQLGSLASGARSGNGRDYYDPTRTIVAEYLRHSGRMEEAAQVEAIGCADPPPRTGFARLDAADAASLRRTMRGW